MFLRIELTQQNQKAIFKTNLGRPGVLFDAETQYTLILT